MPKNNPLCGEVWARILAPHNGWGKDTPDQDLCRIESIDAGRVHTANLDEDNGVKGSWVKATFIARFEYLYDDATVWERLMDEPFREPRPPLKPSLSAPDLPLIVIASVEEEGRALAQRFDLIQPRRPTREILSAAEAALIQYAPPQPEPASEQMLRDILVPVDHYLQRDSLPPPEPQLTAAEQRALLERGLDGPVITAEELLRYRNHGYGYLDPIGIRVRNAIMAAEDQMVFDTLADIAREGATFEPPPIPLPPEVHEAPPADARDIWDHLMEELWDSP